MDQGIIKNLKSKNYQKTEPQSKIECDMYLATFRKFNMLRIRMKLSYMAICQFKTVKEFILEGILNSFNYLKSRGIIECDEDGENNEFYKMIVAGRADLKLIVWKYIKDNLDQKKIKNYDDYSPEIRTDYTEAYNNFLCKEIDRLKTHDAVGSLFKELKFAKDDLEKIQS